MCFVSCLVWVIPCAARAGSARTPGSELVYVRLGGYRLGRRGKTGNMKSDGRANGLERGRETWYPCDVHSFEHGVHCPGRLVAEGSSSIATFDRNFDLRWNPYIDYPERYRP
jgi:hypothetical protein